MTSVNDKYCVFKISGWATDRKSVPEELIRARVMRTGDGTHRNAKLLTSKKESLNVYTEHENQKLFWGFGDEEMTAEDLTFVKLIN